MKVTMIQHFDPQEVEHLGDNIEVVFRNTLKSKVGKIISENVVVEQVREELPYEKSLKAELYYLPASQWEHIKGMLKTLYQSAGSQEALIIKMTIGFFIPKNFLSIPLYKG